MPKPINATFEDVELGITKLRTEITTESRESQGKIAAAIKHLEEKLRGEIGVVQKNVEVVKVELEEADEAAKTVLRAEDVQFVKDLRAEMEIVRRDWAEKVLVEKEKKDVERQIGICGDEAAAALRQAVSQLHTFINDEIRNARRDAKADTEQAAKTAAEALAKATEELYIAISEALRKAKEYCDERKAECTEALRQSIATQTLSDQQRDQKSAKNHAELEKHLEESDQKLLDEVARGDEETAKLHINIDARFLENETIRDENLAAFSVKTDVTFAEVRQVQSDIENFSTRQVTFCIKDASRRLIPPKLERDALPFASYLSPTFDASGAGGLQLELRIFRNDVPPVGEQTAGDCIVVLHAKAGTNIAFSLRVGRQTRVYERKFTADGMLSTDRLCFVGNEISPKNDEFHIVFEVLESVFSLTRYPEPILPDEFEAAKKYYDALEDPDKRKLFGLGKFAKPPDSSDLDPDQLKTVEAERVETVRKFYDALEDPAKRKVLILEKKTDVPAFSDLDEEQMKKVEENKLLEEGEEPEELLDTCFILQRQVNNRLLQQTRSQLEFYKSQMTKRVEWRLEQASLMQKAFPRGTAMTSKEFDAAGIEGMQLIFYPSGYAGATDGYCSFFISAPAGATLKCWLEVGTERRDLLHSWDTAGYFGRTNFCMFSAGIENDAINVALEIEDAHQEVIGEGRMPPASDGIRSLLDDEQGFKTALKLSRTQKTIPSSLRQVKVLPAIWAGRNLHELRAKTSSSLHDSRQKKSSRSAPRLKPLGSP